MASRQQEKERRRQERLAAEREAAQAAARARRLKLGLGGLLSAAVVAVVVVLAIGAGGGGGTASSSGGWKPAASGSAPLPPIRNKDLTTAAKVAGCTVKSLPSEGAGHVVTPVTYRSNPPTSGQHNPEPALDGIYPPGSTPDPVNYVHTLEHGRIEVQYAPGTPKRKISQLETLVSEPLNGKPAYKTLLFQNNTNMPYEVAATSWTKLIGCKSFTPAAFDALRAFRLKYMEQAPEPSIPPNN